MTLKTSFLFWKPCGAFRDTPLSRVENELSDSLVCKMKMFFWLKTRRPDQNASRNRRDAAIFDSSDSRKVGCHPPNVLTRLHLLKCPFKGLYFMKGFSFQWWRRPPFCSLLFLRETIRGGSYNNTLQCEIFPIIVLISVCAYSRSEGRRFCLCAT